MVDLKGGSITHDPRLDRLVEFDERSRNYPIRAMIAPTIKPRSYTWRCDDVLDQGPDGACVGFAFTHEMIARPAEVGGLDAAFAKQAVYWEAQKLDQWPGGAYPGASPFYEGTSVLAGAKRAVALGAAEAYRWSFSLGDLILGIGYHGPAVLGVNWYESMFSPDGDGFIDVTGPVAGGHAILCMAVNIRGGFFTLQNSWGDDWGIEGRCRIAFDQMDLLLRDRGEAVFMVKRHGRLTE